MKNFILKSIFASLLMLCLTSFMTAHGQSPMSLTISDDTGLAVDHYVASWIVYTLSPYTQWPCDDNDRDLGLPPSYPVSVFFNANVNDVKYPVFYVYVRVVGYNAFDIPIVQGDNTAGPMTTAQLQGAWSITVPVGII